MRETVPEFDEATCLAIACPSCMTLDLARSCAGYVTTIINNADLIPTVSPGALTQRDVSDTSGLVMSSANLNPTVSPGV